MATRSEIELAKYVKEQFKITQPTSGRGEYHLRFPLKAAKHDAKTYSKMFEQYGLSVEESKDKISGKYETYTIEVIDADIVKSKNKKLNLK